MLLATFRFVRWKGHSISDRMAILRNRVSFTNFFFVQKGKNTFSSSNFKSKFTHLSISPELVVAPK